MQSIINNKFLQLLKELKPKAQKAFGAYLKALHSTQKIQLSIFEYVYKAAPNFDDVQWLELDKVYAAVFQKPLAQPKDRKNLLNAFSDLTRFLENYLLAKRLEENSFERTYLLQDIYQALGLSKNHVNAVEKSYQAIGKNNRQPLQQFLLNELAYFETDKDSMINSMKHLEEGVSQLNQYYILKKLKYINEIITRIKVLGESSKEISGKQEDLLKLPNTLLTQTPTHEIYWLHYQLNASLDSTTQTKAYETLKQHLLNFPIPDKQLKHDSLIYVCNYAMQQFHKGKTSFQTEAFDFYLLGLKNDFLIIDNIFPRGPFQNMVNIACAQQKFEWARNFLETNKKKLQTAYRQDGYHLGRARIYFGQHKFSKAYKFLSRITFRHLHFKTQASLLTIICLIEIIDLDKLQIEISQLQSSLKKPEGLSSDFVHQLSYFIEIAQQFTKGNISKNRLIKKLEQTPDFPHKNWFEGKLNRL